VDQLTELLLTQGVHEPDSYQQLLHDIHIPPTLCSSFNHPSEFDVRQLTSRFNTNWTNWHSS